MRLSSSSLGQKPATASAAFKSARYPLQTNWIIILQMTRQLSVPHQPISPHVFPKRHTVFSTSLSILINHQLSLLLKMKSPKWILRPPLFFLYFAIILGHGFPHKNMLQTANAAMVLSNQRHKGAHKT